MTDISDTSYKTMGDMALLKTLGDFIKHHRLEQNKTQDQLAKEAGISRSTLVEFEQGKRSNTLTFIQLLRALGLLDVLRHFEIKQQPSPLQLAKLEERKRKRAGKTTKQTNKPKSDW